MRSMLIVLAMAVSMALLGGVAAADRVTTDFEPPVFHTGSVNGQDGWHSAVFGDVPALPEGYDQAVVSSGGVPGFGEQSLRHSNAKTEKTGEFEYQTYSRSNAVNAGEALPNTDFVGEFQFTSTSDEKQDQLHMRMSPDNGHGGRMSFIGLRDTDAGIQATFFDTPELNGLFKPYNAGIYSRSGVHTVRFLLHLVPGPDNDIVRIVIDNVDIGKRLGVCFTTWENFYRATKQLVPVTNSIQFRADNGTAGDPYYEIPGLIGGGYLFDNVITDTTPAAGVVPPDCESDIVVDKETTTQVARPGDLITYTITVRNRGDVTARRLRACDRPPRALRFVQSRTRLQRATGRRLCLRIRRLRPGESRSFRVTFRLRSNVTADTITNGATADTPTGSEPSPVPPAGGQSPVAPVDVGDQPPRRRHDRDVASVVVRRPSACPASRDPRARAAC